MSGKNYLPMPEPIPAELLARAAKLSPALFCDGLKGMGVPMDGCMDAGINAVNPTGPMLLGTAMTVETDNGDNFPVHVATYSAERGYVILIDGKGYPHCAYIGGLIAGAAQAMGVAGVVVDGYMRDQVEIAKMGFPMFSRGYVQRGPGKKDPGKINHPITCGGLQVNPGDLVIGDGDGVTVVPRALVEEAIIKAEEKLAYEKKREQTIAEYTRAIAAGETPPDLAPDWVREMLAAGTP
ncbi:MAG: RraA family protein [Oscillospiraceae bacterium]|nr:RraA family protein [Oscillospiraceae bacterium]